MAEFNFKELTARAHLDYVGANFPDWYQQNRESFNLPSLTNIARRLLLGGKYFTRLVVSHKGVKYEFPNEPLIGLSLNKTIKETATVGRYRKGTVKEYINTEDYQIIIRGVCVNEAVPINYPSSQVEELNRIFEINEALEVESNPFLELFDISKIVFKSIDYEDMAGQQTLQKYVIRAVSDQDFFAELSERNNTRNDFLNN